MKMSEPGRTGSESDDPDSPEYTFRESGRDQERRNTDFSQADNDLKRFLSEREHKRRDSAEQVDILLSPTYKQAFSNTFFTSQYLKEPAFTLTFYIQYVFSHYNAFPKS